MLQKFCKNYNNVEELIQNIPLVLSLKMKKKNNLIWTKDVCAKYAYHDVILECTYNKKSPAKMKAKLLRQVCVELEAFKYLLKFPFNDTGWLLNF